MRLESRLDYPIKIEEVLAQTRLYYLNICVLKNSLDTIFQKYLDYGYSSIALILSSNKTQHDLYGVFRLKLGILVGKAHEFILELRICVIIQIQPRNSFTSKITYLHIGDLKINNNQ